MFTFISNTYFACGVLFVIEGSLGIILGKTYFRGWREVSILEAIITFLLGIALIYYDLKRKPYYVKCNKCIKIFKYEETIRGKCPNCNIKTKKATKKEINEYENAINQKEVEILREEKEANNITKPKKNQKER
ncbi:hypothetical protein [Campylobacter sp. MG1]|uniref:hypothetical protein n=1 Tax=Campylobacter sp. MG1 TaxID=2976332 RepID=UPI00226D3CBB|nr:hypothetical protein [Campylobacter sp. MG1]